MTGKLLRAYIRAVLLDQPGARPTTADIARHCPGASVGEVYRELADMEAQGSVTSFAVEGHTARRWKLCLVKR